MRRLKFVNVKRLALCKRGRNNLQTLYKSDGTVELQTLVKGDSDTGELLTVIFPKGLADIDGDFADTEEALDSIASSLIRNKGSLDIEHEGDVLPHDDVHIVEIFRIQETDARFHDWKNYQGEPEDVSGGVAARLQINRPDLRESFRSGEWDGVSLFGPAAVEQVENKAASQRIAARMGQNKPMDPELKEALSLLTKSVATLTERAAAQDEADAKAAADAAAEAAKVEAAPSAPAFTGDASDPDALTAHAKALKAFELQRDLAAGKITADQLVEMSKSMAAPSASDEEAGIVSEDSDEVRGLKHKLFKAQRVSAAPGGKAQSGSTTEASLRKAQDDDVAAMAKLLNGSGSSSDGGFQLV